MVTDTSLVQPVPSHVYGTRIAFVVVMLGAMLSRLYLMFIRPFQLFDESYYLSNTIGILRYGAFPPFGWNPGIALLNTLFYLPFHNMALGLDYASRIGMAFSGIVTFVMIAVAAWMVTRKLAFVTFAVLLALVSAPFWSGSTNSSDHYYGMMVIVNLVLLFHTLPKSTTSIWWTVTAGSLAVAATFRNDGLLVLAATSLLYIWNCWRDSKNVGVALGRFTVRWAVLPALIIALFLIPFWRDGAFYDGFTDSLTGQDFKITQRTYFAFMQGTGWVQRFELQAEGKAWWQEYYRLATEQFGTPVENNNSVFQAILRNPVRWVARVYVNTRDFFLAWHNAYLQTALPIIIMVIGGFVTLVRRQKQHTLAILLCLFPTLSYFFLTFWTDRYVLVLAPVWTILATYALANMAEASDGKPVWTRVITPLAITIFTLCMLKVLDRPASEVEPTSPLTLWIAAILFLGVVGLEVLRPSTAVRRIAVPLLALLLLAGVFRPLPQGIVAPTAYEREIQLFLIASYPEYGGHTVCLDNGNLDAKSLIWYARQRPRPLYDGSLVTAAEEGTLLPALIKDKCRYALHVGITDLSAITDSPDFHVIYKSLSNRILLFELASPVPE